MGNYIVKKLEDIQNSQLISFHVPGHKMGKIYHKLGYEKILNKIHKLDTTEIDGTDNLHNAQEIIKESQDRAARVFNSDKTIYLVNGSTCGIQASIMSVCSPKSKLITNRDCHQSVINACILGDITPVYIEPQVCISTNILQGVKFNNVKEVIDNNLDAKAIILTYPTYYGITYDLEEICEYAHSKDITVIIDEAHGAHLGLSDSLPKQAITQGADIVIQSTHKTLPAFTQSSMIHIKGDRVNENNVLSMLRIIESSSPSYMLLSSLELAVDIYDKYGKKLMDELLDIIEEFTIEFKNNKNILIKNENDKTKIFISLKELGITGYELDSILRDRYNIQVELSNYYGVLLICTIGNTRADFKSLETALKGIISSCENKKIRLQEIDYPKEIPIKIINPREAFYKDKKSVKLKESIGKISGEHIIPYPPGVSLVSPGEIITQEIITYIQEGVKSGMIICGIKDNTLENIEIIEV